ncbi:hypothetical protein Desaci_2689 [Desulfosporosinus acidiphilus SJ4]|uniref:Uncharacterized protein n=1 Tax=Desulfosporosinus acidiphilus (strain DSM 22704 / JCM 16185 / SJ4) TaxID=646529 RepID=I4D747_DESAJ|nr:DUF2321 domain-containing protein [Desulfosporosinus acidiphilus]AFM41621.1 hypothetical protein Desaci_2689 [Desulfosporosinus acidiphilus SJ4]
MTVNQLCRKQDASINMFERTYYMINRSSMKVTESETKDFETFNAKNISNCIKCNAFIGGVESSYCHQCGTPYPWALNKYNDLIKMVEYFELNPEDAEC